MKHFKWKAFLAAAVLGGAFYVYSRYGEAWNLPSFTDIKEAIKEKVQMIGEMEQPNYSLDEGDSFSNQYDILEGDLNYSEIALPDGFSAQGIQKLKMDAAGCVVRLVDSPDAAFHIEAKGCKKLQYYVEKATLYITVIGGITSGAGITDGVKNTVLTLYCPANTLQISVEAKLGAGGMELGDIVSQYVDLVCGAGKISVGNLDADELKIDLDAGAVSIERAIADVLTAETGMGTLNIASLEFGKGTVICSMGNVDLTVKGLEQDHNYNVKAAGMVTVGDQEFKGLTGERKIENGADDTLKIECSVGNVTIHFVP